MAGFFGFDEIPPGPSQDGGEQSPLVRELGDAPDLTRLMRSDTSDDKGRETIIASWSSLERFARQFIGDNGSKWWASRNVRNSWSEDFNGCESFDTALDLAINGWKEGGEIIERTRGYIRALNPLSTRVTRYGIAGTSPNVPRAIAGEILNMRLPEIGKSKKKKTITIIYNMCENGGANAEAISNKAAVAAALIDEIESKGFACEVISAVATTSWSGKVGKAFEYVRIKESHHPIDINRLAFGLGHAAMFRGLFFADMQRHHEFAPIGQGLGCAASTRPTKELNEEQIYTITAANLMNIGLFKDIDTAVTDGLNRIVSDLQRQGCPAFPKKDHEDDLDEETEEDDPDWDGEDDGF